MTKYRDVIKPMEPHVGEILDSRIVDHNLDAGTANKYIRWGNGLQLILQAVTVDTTQDAAHSFTSVAAFRPDSIKVIFPGFEILAGSGHRTNAKAVIGGAMSWGGVTTFQVATDGSGTNTSYEVNVVIVGFW